MLVTLIPVIIAYQSVCFWSFVEKTSVKQDLKCKVFKFSDNLSVLSEMDPLQMRLQVWLTFLSDLWVRLTFGQKYPQDEALGQVDIRSDLWSG